MMKNKAGLVALIVLAIATLLMIFFVLPNIQGEKAPMTAGQEAKPADNATTQQGSQAPNAQADAGNTDNSAAPADKPADARTATTTPDNAATPAETKPDAQASTDKPADPTASWVVPGFDVLRVERDGSTVVAGRAQPNTKLEIVNGNTVVGTADVGSTGDFAAVFDKPLPAGDYQLTLRSVGENGATKSSEEVATVSVPKDESGETLAMVAKPGEASRIITSPNEGEAGQAAAKTGRTPTTGADASGTAAEKPADQAANAAAEGNVAAADAAKPATGDAAAQTQAAAGVTSNVAGTVPAAVAVSAVEIEGRKIFVAGNARPGSIVRIYADDALVGEAKTDEQGRFVVDSTFDLAVGNHTIRVDMLDAAGTKVAMRAAVPFNRPAGDQVAAVAQPSAQGSGAPFDGGVFDGLRMEVSKAFGLLKGLFANGKVPSGEQLAAARSATEIALGSLANFKAPTGIDAAVGDMIARTAKAAADALAMLKAVPADSASVGAALGKIEMAVGSALEPHTDGGAQMTATQPPAAEQQAATPSATAGAADQPAAGTGAAAESGAGAPPADNATAAQTPSGSATLSADQTAAEPQTVQQAPLQQSKSSVIIRRGDTLWQISRRVYGAGVRYTTIYLANEDQITDPDRILPGQIFGVPNEAMPEAESEAIHRKHMQEQR